MRKYSSKHVPNLVVVTVIVSNPPMFKSKAARINLRHTAVTHISVVETNAKCKDTSWRPRIAEQNSLLNKLVGGD